MLTIGRGDVGRLDQQITAQAIITKFPSLVALSRLGGVRDHYAHSLAVDFRGLCQLNQLALFNAYYCIRDDPHRSFGEMFGMEALTLASTPRFQSLEYLSLEVRLRRNDEFHSIFDTPQLEHMFPELKILMFSFLFEAECTSCGNAYTRQDLEVDVVENNRNVRIALKRCARQIIGPWRRYCTGLQHSPITCTFHVNFRTGSLFMRRL